MDSLPAKAMRDLFFLCAALLVASWDLKASSDSAPAALSELGFLLGTNRFDFDDNGTPVSSLSTRSEASVDDMSVPKFQGKTHLPRSEGGPKRNIGCHRLHCTIRGGIISNQSQQKGATQIKSCKNTPAESLQHLCTSTPVKPFAQCAMRHALKIGGSIILTAVWLGLGVAFVTHPYPHAASPGSIGRPRHTNTIDNITAARFATAISSSARQAKETFLRDIGRKQSGEDALASELDASIARLIAETDKSGLPSPSRTTVGNLQSWRGRWRICYAPHIEALGKFLLTAFPIVDYDFPTEGGRMLSNVRYESAVFGSGWLNADGRIELVDHESSGAVPSGDRSAGRRREEVVKVGYEEMPCLCATTVKTHDCHAKSTPFCLLISLRGTRGVGYMRHG